MSKCKGVLSGRETASEIAGGAVTHNGSSHQDEFSTVHTLSEGAKPLPLERCGHVQKQSANLAHRHLSGPLTERKPETKRLRGFADTHKPRGGISEEQN